MSMIGRMMPMSGWKPEPSDREKLETALAQLAEASQRIEALQAERENDNRIWERRLDDALAERDQWKRNANLAAIRRLAAAEAQIEALTASQEYVKPHDGSPRDDMRCSHATSTAPLGAENYELQQLQARAEGRPSWQPRVEALIAKWRAEAAAEQRVSFHADELSALLAPEQEEMRDEKA